MFNFLLILAIVFFVLLILVAAIEPEHSFVSHYELKRRANGGDMAAANKLLKQSHRFDILSVLNIMTSLLLIVTSFLIIACFGWVLGIFLVLAILTTYNAFARLKIMRRFAHRCYRHIEHSLLKATITFSGFMKFIRMTGKSDINEVSISSRQELQHLIDESEAVLSTDEKRLVIHSLAFSDKLVRSVMTLVAAIDSIKKNEFLGPLTLDELHKTGHASLPVIAQDINHIVGILYLQNLLALDIKRSVTAEKAMDTHVLYIHANQTLPDALAAFLRTHHHVFIVIDESQQTVGLITIDDILEALIGRKINDNFNDHESIRAVASRHMSKE
jgi:CBS domain containing-hemolysin-like protein